MVFALLYALVSPLLWFFAWLGAWTLKKARLRFREEQLVRRIALQRVRQFAQGKEVLLFHAASAGEFEQLKPLLPKIDRKRFFILQTFYSHTIYKKEKDSALFDACCYHPLDSIFSALSLFKQFKPSLYIVNRHDIWPAHLLAAKVLGIKRILINANLHTKSQRVAPLFLPLNRWMFEAFDAITCGSQRLVDNIKKLAPKASVHLLGETRFERVITRAAENPYDHFSYDLRDRKNIVLGSIIPSDYDVILLGIKRFLESREKPQSFRIVVVPHEVDTKTVTYLESKIKELGFSVEIFTSDSSDGTSDFLIVNTVGVLAELYGYGYTAYVGAGFGAGVHSVIEPAAYGIPVFYGPHYHILDEAIEMVENKSGSVVTSEDDVYVYLDSLEDLVEYDILSKKTEAYIETIGNCSEQISELIYSLVSSPKSDMEL